MRMRTTKGEKDAVIVRIKSWVFQLAPYGIVCWWMAYRHRLSIDKPLLFYPGFVKRLKRLVKFSLPYGVVIPFRERAFRKLASGLQPSPASPAHTADADALGGETSGSCDRDPGVLVLPPLPAAAELEPHLLRRPAERADGAAPDITVVTVVFNIVKGGRTEAFRQCLASVQAQEGVTIEHLIVDGASKDETLKLLDGNENARHPMRVFSQPDKGIYDAMNKGLVLARGRYVTFLNSDDFYHDPLGLRDAVRRLDETKAEFSYAPVVMLGEAGRPLDHPNAKPDVTRLCCVMAFSHQSIVMRADALRGLGGFDIGYRSAADYDSVLRMVFSGCHAVRVDRSYVTFRAGGYSWENVAESQAECGRLFAHLYGRFLGFRLTPEEGRMIYVTQETPALLADKVQSHVAEAFGFADECRRPRKRISVGDRWNVFGLYDDEGWGAWGGKSLRIRATITEELRGKDLRLQLYIGAFADGKGVPTVTVRCNGCELRTMSVGNFSPTRYEVRCPAAVVAAGTIILDIETSCAVRPAGETRTLGLSFERLEISAVAPTPKCQLSRPTDVVDLVRTQAEEIAKRDVRIAELESQSKRLESDKVCLETAKVRLESDKARLESDKVQLESCKVRLEGAVEAGNARIAALVADNGRIRASLSVAEGVLRECRSRFPAKDDFCVCNVCCGKAEFRFRGRILNKYDVRYYLCPQCGHVQTEAPYWLDEAYGSAISLSDTGIVQRNQYMREVTLAVIARFFDPSARVLEYAGGYGMLTRMLRDSGVACRWYDKYAKPVFAAGFEDDGKRRYDLVTAFEALEHFTEPLAELETVFSRAGTLIFSEELLPDPVPVPADWWYYCLEHGQHVNLYARKTLEYLAARFGKRLLYHGSVGLLTDREIDDGAFAECVDNCHSIVEALKLPSLTVSDMNLMIEKMAGGK